MDDPDAEFTLWCGNVSERVTEEILYELFLQAGPLQKVKIPKDRENRQQNFAFVTFKHVESVAYAISLFENIKLFGKSLVMKQRESKASPQSQHQQQYQPQRQQPRYMLPKEPNRPQTANLMPANDVMQFSNDFYVGNPMAYDTFRNPNDMHISQNYNRRNRYDDCDPPEPRQPTYYNDDHWQQSRNRNNDNRGYHSNRHSNKSNNKRNRR